MACWFCEDRKGNDEVLRKPPSGTEFSLQAFICFGLSTLSFSVLPFSISDDIITAQSNSHPSKLEVSKNKEGLPGSPMAQ